MIIRRVFYEPAALGYPLGASLRKRYGELPWTAIESHNNIPALRAEPNEAFGKLKQNLIIGVRKTHRYVENHKISDFLVPYTSSGCGAMCLYCYLVCNYNTCSYLRVFVNREDMMDRLVRHSLRAGRSMVYEVGSNSDLILENTVTRNLPWTIEEFARRGKGKITFPTKFADVAPLLALRHQGKTIFRMSVNPDPVIRGTEFGTAPLADRISAVNQMAGAGYPVGLLIAPVIFAAGWREQYLALLDQLQSSLSPAVRKNATFEVIFMTYSYIHRAINQAAFPNAVDLFDPAAMTGRGRGKYWYRAALRQEGEVFFRRELSRRFPDANLVYVV